MVLRGVVFTRDDVVKCIRRANTVSIRSRTAHVYRHRHRLSRVLDATRRHVPMIVLSVPFLYVQKVLRIWQAKHLFAIAYITNLL